MQTQSRPRSAAKMKKARAYQSITPANNMILKKKWDQSRFDMHRMKVVYMYNYEYVTNDIQIDVLFIGSSISIDSNA